METSKTAAGGVQPAPARALTHDLTSDGFTVFDGPFKIATVGCVTDGPKETRQKEDGSLVTDAQGHVIQFPTFRKLPRRQWGIHFTSPSLNVELLEELLASLPAGDDHTEGHKSPRVAK